MGSITIRHFDDLTKSRLRIRAAEHGHSMEEEARIILRAALVDSRGGETGMATRIRRRFAGIGDIQLPQPEREPVPDPPSLDC